MRRRAVWSQMSASSSSSSTSSDQMWAMSKAWPTQPSSSYPSSAKPKPSTSSPTSSSATRSSEKPSASRTTSCIHPAAPSSCCSRTTSLQSTRSWRAKASSHRYSWSSGCSPCSGEASTSRPRSNSGTTWYTLRSWLCSGWDWVFLSSWALWFSTKYTRRLSK